MRFDGKSAIVTGAGSGIGATTARLLAERGARVFAVDVNAESVEAIVSEIGSSASGHVADLASQDAVEEMVATGLSKLGRLDILINNAGIGSLGRTLDLDPAEWRKVMAVDLDAVFYACRVALPHLIEARGCIVNTASISGMAADYGFTAYNVAKGGLIALTRVVAIDYAAEGVRVNAVSPGFTFTPLLSMMPQALVDEFVSRIPMRRSGTPAEIAEAILFLASDAASYITGHNLVADGGLIAHTGQPDPIAFFKDALPN